MLWKAARAMSEEEFDKVLQEIGEIDQRAPKWLLDHADPVHWAEFLFQGKRYGHLTSNIAESLNSWLLDAREKPILALFDQVRHQLMKWFDLRRKLETRTTGILVSKVAIHIRWAMAKAYRYRCIASTETQFEVRSPITGGEYRVNIDTKTCSCKSWQMTGIQCSHALSVILSLEKDPQEYTEQFYTLEFYRNTYANIPSFNVCRYYSGGSLSSTSRQQRSR